MSSANDRSHDWWRVQDLNGLELNYLECRNCGCTRTPIDVYNGAVFRADDGIYPTGTDDCDAEIVRRVLNE